MVTHLIRYRHEERVGWGVVSGGVISPLDGNYARTADLIERGESDWRSAATKVGNLRLDDVEALSPITTPCRVMCQGANYRQHAIESGMNPDERAFNLFFDKTDATITGPDAPVVRPAHVALLDFEVELALVMRQEVSTPTAITPENLHRVRLGVTIANDLSARDVQLLKASSSRARATAASAPPDRCWPYSNPRTFPARQPRLATRRQRRTTPRRQHRQHALPPCRDADRADRILQSQPGRRAAHRYPARMCRHLAATPGASAGHRDASGGQALGVVHRNEQAQAVSETRRRGQRVDPQRQRCNRSRRPADHNHRTVLREGAV